MREIFCGNENLVFDVRENTSKIVWLKYSMIHSKFNNFLCSMSAWNESITFIMSNDCFWSKNQNIFWILKEIDIYLVKEKEDILEYSITVDSYILWPFWPRRVCRCCSCKWPSQASFHHWICFHSIWCCHRVQVEDTNYYCHQFHWSRIYCCGRRREDSKISSICSCRPWFPYAGTEQPLRR